MKILTKAKAPPQFGREPRAVVHAREANQLILVNILYNFVVKTLIYMGYSAILLKVDYLQKMHAAHMRRYFHL